LILIFVGLIFVGCVVSAVWCARQLITLPMDVDAQMRGRTC